MTSRVGKACFALVVMMGMAASGGHGSLSSPSAQQQADAASGAAQVNKRHPQAAKGTAPGVFDYYLLTLSWSPEYCLAHPTDAQCASQPGFVMHGLWPENTNGTYPEACSKAPGPSNPAQYKDL